MAPETAEVVRRWLWAFEHDADMFRDLLHPDIAWFQIEDDRTPSYGIQAAMRSRRQWFETWDEHHLALEEVIEEGDSVIAAIHITARGKAPGVAVDVRFYATRAASAGVRRTVPSGVGVCVLMPQGSRSPVTGSPRRNFSTCVGIASVHERE